jgi:hypothetical protein
MKIARRTISKTSMLQSDPLNCVERIIKKIREIKQNKVLIKVLLDYIHDRKNLPEYKNVSDAEEVGKLNIFI